MNVNCGIVYWTLDLLSDNSAVEAMADAMVSCCCCQRSLRRIGGYHRRSMALSAEFIQSHSFLMAYLAEVVDLREFGEEDRICRPCFQRAERYGQQQVPQNQLVEDISTNDSTPEHTVVVDIAITSLSANVRDQATQANISRFSIPGYTRAPYNTHLCIFNSCSRQDLHRIHVDLRALVLKEKGFYIPRGSRVCQDHLLNAIWLDIKERCRRILSEFSPAHMKEMMDLLRTKTVFLDFDKITSIRDEVFQYYIGFTKSQFTVILRNTPTIEQRFKNKAGRALATVLTKLHTGDSNQRLSSIFRMSRTTFEKTMSLVREDLINYFVSRHLGFDHITREEVISRCLAIPKALFGSDVSSPPRAIVILDGTYIYLQKSSNYYFQRKSYSLHKYRHLIKPFLIVCPDGHIIDIYGLYEAIKSDAIILSDIMKSTTDPFHWFFEENDVLILDRGFRDCIEEVESYGYKTFMPASKDEEEFQLTTKQANESRKVTMCRWVVETINGRLKNQFRQLRSQNFNRAAGHLFDEIRIAAALLNAFGEPLRNHRLVTEIIAEIAPRSGEVNQLAELVRDCNLNRRRTNFQAINAEVAGMDEFPLFTEDELIIYALGTYQIQQARSYYGEHFKNGSYLIEIYKDNVQLYSNTWLLRGKIQSRHTNRRTYYVYILIKRGFESIRAIQSHYCTCLVGKRTLGCCAHVMSIIWYLGLARYDENLRPPAEHLDLIIRQDIEVEANEESENEG